MEPIYRETSGIYVFERAVDIYMIQDYKMIEDIGEEVAALDLPYKFVTAHPTSYWELEKPASSIKFHLIDESYKDGNAPRFSEEFQKYAYDGRTITYTCLQMAVYMGFKEIYLLGVDFNYTPDVYAEANHFAGYHPEGDSVRRNPFPREKQILAYESAKKYADAHGINIYNATRGGKLEVFERVRFDELFF